MIFESREINRAESTLGLDLLCEMCPHGGPAEARIPGAQGKQEPGNSRKHMK